MKKFLLILSLFGFVVIYGCGGSTQTTKQTDTNKSQNSGNQGSNDSSSKNNDNTKNVDNTKKVDNISNVEKANQNFNRAIEYLNRGAYDAAIKEYLTGLDLDPNNYQAMNELGITYQKSGQLDKSKETFNKAIKMAPDKYDAYQNLGILYLYDDRDINKAIECFDTVARINQDKKFCSKNYFIVANEFLNEGELTKAQYYCEKGLSFDSNNAFGLIIYGYILCLRGEVKIGVNYVLKGKDLTNDTKLREFADKVIKRYKR